MSLGGEDDGEDDTGDGKDYVGDNNIDDTKKQKKYRWESISHYDLKHRIIEYGEEFCLRIETVLRACATVLCVQHFFLNYVCAVQKPTEEHEAKNEKVLRSYT